MSLVSDFIIGVLTLQTAAECSKHMPTLTTVAVCVLVCDWRFHPSYILSLTGLEHNNGCIEGLASPRGLAWTEFYVSVLESR